MNKVKPASLCSRCGEPFAEHSDGETCPDGGGMYGRHPSRPAHSFSEAEIEWLAKVVDALHKRADTRELRRAPELVSVVKKTVVMRRAIERAQKARSR